MEIARRRLPNRRPSETRTLEVAGQVFDVTVGFGDDGQPGEVFMAAGKEGSQLNAMLADAAVVVSVALQYGVPALALAKSVGRLPGAPVTPEDLDHARPTKRPASPLGAALDLLRELETSGTE